MFSFTRKGSEAIELFIVTLTKIKTSAKQLSVMITKAIECCRESSIMFVAHAKPISIDS